MGLVVDIVHGDVWVNWRKGGMVSIYGDGLRPISNLEVVSRGE